MGSLCSTSVCNTLVCVDVRLILKRQKYGACFSFCNVCDKRASSYADRHPHLNAYVASSHFTTFPLHKVCYIVVLVWLYCVSPFFFRNCST